MAFPLIGLAAALAGEFLPDIIGAVAKDRDSKDGGIGKTLVDVATAITGKSEPDEIMSVLKNNPQLVIDLQMKMADERLAYAQIEMLDRQAAREMGTKSPLSTFAAVLISVMITSGFGLALYAVLTGAIPEGNRDIALILLGHLSAAFLGVVAYWVGSSKGSQEKTSLLANVLKK